MKLAFLEKFADPVMKTPGGQGAFLAGVVLGMIARGQASGDKLDSAPLFKQLNFGRMRKRELKRHLSRVPQLIKAYDLKYKDSDLKERIQDLAGYADELLLKDESFDLGVDGNFAFATAFMNAPEYFWTVFGKQQKETEN